MALEIDGTEFDGQFASSAAPLFLIFSCVFTAEKDVGENWFLKRDMSIWQASEFPFMGTFSCCCKGGLLLIDSLMLLLL